MYKSSGQKQKYLLTLTLTWVSLKSMCFHTATYRSFLSFCDRDGRQRSIPSDPFEWREYNLLFLEGLPCGKRVRPLCPILWRCIIALPSFFICTLPFCQCMPLGCPPSPSTHKLACTRADQWFTMYLQSNTSLLIITHVMEPAMKGHLSCWDILSALLVCPFETYFTVYWRLLKDYRY